jgi:SAM-dependent methyltransferase
VRFYQQLKDLGTFSVREFVAESAASLQPKSRILDAGAGQCTYKPFFKHCDYVAVDIGVGDSTWDYSHLDIIAPLDRLPVADASFDAILCTEVLEHLDKPEESLRELCRVLKPDGRLFLSVPFFHHEHQVPYDFFRYTSFGLKHLLQKAGFRTESIVIRPVGGVFKRWSYELTSLFELFPGIRVGRRLTNFQDLILLPFRGALLLLIRSVQALLLLLDPLDKSQKASLGWHVIAKK